MITQASLGVLIPAYNEEASLPEVVQNIRRYLPDAEIVVINDGSRDNTKDTAEANGAIVLDLPFNLGIGGAVQTGLKYAALHYDYAIEIDADGQHDPKHAPELLQKVQEEQIDMLIGSRFITTTKYKPSIMRFIGIRLFSWLIDLVTGKKIYDPTSGYRVYNKRTLRFLADHYPSDFPEPESIVLLLRNKFVVKESPVEMHPRKIGVSSVNAFKAGYFVASNAIAILISSLKARVKYVN